MARPGSARSAWLQQQAALGQQFVDGEQDLLCQFVFLQAVAKPQNGAFIWQAGTGGRSL